MAKRIAYIVANDGAGKYLHEHVFSTIASGEHGAEVMALYFIENGVYHLVKNGPLARYISAAHERNVRLLVSKQSIRDRKVQRMLIEGVEEASVDSFYRLAQQADFIIAI